VQSSERLDEYITNNNKEEGIKMEYTKFQQKYIDEVGGRAHQNAVEIIGLLENTVRAQLWMAKYRLCATPPKWVLNVLKDAKEAGIDV
jgi:hypothetical protein